MARLVRIQRSPPTSGGKPAPSPANPAGNDPAPRRGLRIALVGLVSIGVVMALAVGLWLGGRRQAAGPGTPASPGAIVARVNGMTVTTRDIDVELIMQKVMRAQRGQAITANPADLAAFRRDILDQLVDQRLMENDAAARAISITAEAALGEMPQWAVGTDTARLRSDALAEGLSDAEYADWARRQVTMAHYLRAPEVQALGVAQVQDNGGIPRPATSSDIAAALEIQADVAFRFGAFGEGDEAVEVSMAREGEPAPDFALKTLAGETLRLSDLRGKPVVINFWATWCGPCKVEIPLFDNVFQRNKDKGLVILGVNVQEQSPVVAKFVGEFGMSFPVVLDESGQVSTLYRVRALPTSIFVSPDGKIALAHRGSVVQRAQLLEMIRRILPDAGT